MACVSIIYRPRVKPHAHVFYSITTALDTETHVAYTMVNPAGVMVLYRAILRQGRAQLKLTDQTFFRKMVKGEFQKKKALHDRQELKFQLEVSEHINNW